MAACFRTLSTTARNCMRPGTHLKGSKTLLHHPHYLCESCQCRSSSSSQVLRATMLPMQFDHTFNGRHYNTQRPPQDEVGYIPNHSALANAIPLANHFDPATFAKPAPGTQDAGTISSHSTIPVSDAQTTVNPDKTFYRRELPPVRAEHHERMTKYKKSLIALNAEEGRRLIKESLAAGYAEAFLQLSGNLAHQSDPAFCGLSSLAMVLNTLEIDPQRQWKGVWRWYDETLLDCLGPMEQIKQKGITFDEFACLARCNGLDVEARRFDDLSYEQFVRDVKAVCAGDGTVHMVASFSRKVMDQTGDGHFSPIAAFHEAEGKVLVLDVARFKYPSYFAPLKKMYEAFAPIDKETGKSRGYFLLRKLKTIEDDDVDIENLDEKAISLEKKSLKKSGPVSKKKQNDRDGIVSEDFTFENDGVMELRKDASGWDIDMAKIGININAGRSNSAVEEKITKARKTAQESLGGSFGANIESGTSSLVATERQEKNKQKKPQIEESLGPEDRVTEKAITELGYSEPTTIQAKGIPVALQGLDMCAAAVTGSGKTAAFMIPILERLLYRPKSTPTVRVLILVPTRELGVQCLSVASKLAKYTDIQMCLCVGGLPLKNQEAELRKKPDIVIATPGRLIDHIHNTPSFTIDTIEIIVIDEADRILEDGFAAELDEIIKSTPKSRQTLLFSATMTDDVDNLIKLSLNRPVRLFVDQNTAIASNLTQEFIRVRSHKEDTKPAMLAALCSRTYTSNVIIFFGSKVSAHYMKVLFGVVGLRAAELHGNLTQAQRLEALEQFKKGTVDFLIATNLAARGLDISGVETVINYDMPTSYAQYVHRVGRTARGGNVGIAVSFISETDRQILKMAIKNSKLAVKQRVIPADVIAKFHEAISKVKGDIKEILAEERVEKDLQQAEMKVQKAENLIKYKDEIQSRPARTWFKKEEKSATEEGDSSKRNLVRMTKHAVEAESDGVAPVKRLKSHASAQGSDFERHLEIMDDNMGDSVSDYYERWPRAAPTWFNKDDLGASQPI
ncbi:nucleolar DEAD-box protein required for synthesis of 60S ribosomal subunit [Phlyctochytrium bullatum]|nr:nucleolar DEAD-box protein required for synthesis of 60S ribosomal subunit [Phlyctochytrium bullatum]